MFAPDIGHSPSGSWPVKSIFAAGCFGFRSFLFFGSRFSNSKPTSFLSVNTRNALNGLPLREMKRSSKSVLPVLNSFFICSRSTDCCKMIFPDRKSHVLFGPTDFSHTEVIPSSKSRPLHLGHL